MIDVYKSLDYFFDWIKEKIQKDLPSLPRFDAAMLFTRLDIGFLTDVNDRMKTHEACVCFLVRSFATSINHVMKLKSFAL